MGQSATLNIRPSILATGFKKKGAPCFTCGESFEYNTTRVPSVTTIEGDRGGPICRLCINYGNPRRVKLGLDPIVPLSGAYVPEPDA